MTLTRRGFLGRLIVGAVGAALVRIGIGELAVPKCEEAVDYIAMTHDGTDSYIQNATGVIHLQDMWFREEGGPVMHYTIADDVALRAEESFQPLVRWTGELT